MALSAKKSKRTDPAAQAALKEVMKVEVKKHRVNVDVDQNIFIAAKARAAMNQTSISEILRQCLSEYANEEMSK